MAKFKIWREKISALNPKRVDCKLDKDVLNFSFFLFGEEDKGHHITVNPVWELWRARAISVEGYNKFSPLWDIYCRNLTGRVRGTIPCKSWQNFLKRLDKDKVITTHERRKFVKAISDLELNSLVMR